MTSEPGLAFHCYGSGSLSEFLGDFIVFRGLNPCDPRLPRQGELLARAGLSQLCLPRKHEPGYARMVVELLHQARNIAAPNVKLKRLILLGDTHLSDGGAFENLCLVGGWEGLAFIGSENDKPARLEADKTASGLPIYLANRWALLEELERIRVEQAFPIDEATVIVIDLDKTALGARGRNAAVIDRARLLAMRQTVEGLLGADFDPAGFQANYKVLNQPAYHPFTEDNQDYLAYLCLLLGSGGETLETLLRQIQSGELRTFRQYIDQMEARKAHFPAALRSIHAEIYARVSSGDPTPFKSFRRQEYHTTAGLMGALPDETPVKQMLADEIVITQEVCQRSFAWQRDGALLFGLSDKPDEASLPTPDLAEQGWLPLHRIVTHIVGEVNDV